MTDHAAGTSNGVTNHGHVESKSSLGGFFKRLSSPKFHRSRSKSPMTNGSNRSKNKSWVTVEIKNGVDDGVDTTDKKSLQTSPNVVRSGTDGHLSSTTTSCSTSSVPGSPMSSSSLHNGFSPSSPSRVRSSFGNLFNRGSFKKQHQQKSATLQQQSSTTNKHDNYETRTRTQSEQELNDDDDVEKRRIPKSSTTAKSKFDAFIAQLSHKTHSEGGRDSSKNSSTQQPEVANAVGRAALSEENLVSKSFVCENTSILFSPDPVASSTSTTNGVAIAKFPPTNCLSTSTGYHSQDSVFDSPPTVAARLPSYVRLSCTLSGYKNYRNVDIRTPSPVRSPQMPRIVENFSSSSTIVVDGQQQQNPHPHNNIVHQLPAGKSLVERRLEKFQAIKLEEKKPSANETTMNSVDSNLASNGVTPTPIRDIISSFNKLNLNDSSSNTTSTPLAAQRPRQKPPPVPPRFDSQLSDEFENYNLTKSNGFKENSPPPTTTNGGSLLNDVLSAADAVQSTTNVSNETFSNNNVDFYATIESKTTTTMNSTEAAISAVVVEPVNSYVDKNIAVVVSEQPSNGRTIKIDDDYVAASTAANGIETLASTNFYALSNVKNGNGGESLMNGHDYRIIANQQRERLEKLLKDAENDLCDQTIPENASEKLRMAVGKLRLLLRKKFATFEDLIEKNLNPIVDDPRPTLDLDLDGYYQLVKIELDDIDNYFGVVERLRANGWCTCESDDEVDSKPSAKQTGKKIIPVASKSATSVTSTSAAAASKAKEAARQRLKDARNAAIERQKATATTNADNVQFFGP